ncbi:hypothetical protein KDK95_23275 [Actinospica sp. MGRD01-02]|uniref:Uncharacterized protein n=1 Tax=Actinospica acidithermotolerans TaxID=2828514 RepID=A0A941EKG6_9ACTN|nr:hypothetical protein [Actinospica acidithermotolerans]MBR7829249.1 hypothetical protein [Actinospica acidithermotolerans]
MEEVELEFNKAMRRIYAEAKAELGYNASRFLQMVERDGGLTTARRLLWSADPSDGFTVLWEKSRLDLSVEAHVLLPQFEPLFTDEDRERARERLEQYEWTARRKRREAG